MSDSEEEENSQKPVSSSSEDNPPAPSTPPPRSQQSEPQPSCSYSSSSKLQKKPTRGKGKRNDPSTPKKTLKANEKKRRSIIHEQFCHLMKILTPPKVTEEERKEQRESHSAVILRLTAMRLVRQDNMKDEKGGFGLGSKSFQFTNLHWIKQESKDGNKKGREEEDTEDSEDEEGNEDGEEEKDTEDNEDEDEEQDEN